MTAEPHIAPGHYVVIGGSGLIGSHVLTVLADRDGVRVTAVGHAREPRVQAANIKPLRCDGLVPGAFDDILADADAVVYCAGVLASTRALDAAPAATVFDNIRLGTNVLEALHRTACPRVVWVSSTTGYPESDAPRTEAAMFAGDPPERWFGIGWTYRYLEKQCAWLAMAGAGAASVTVLRPTMVYGEHQDFDSPAAHFLPSLVKAVVNRERPIDLRGVGGLRRELIHAGDVARAVLLAAACPPGFRTYNVSGGAPRSLAEYLDLLIDIDGFADARVETGTPLGEITDAPPLDCGLAIRELGFKPETDLTDGLRRLVAWCRETGRR